MSPLSILALVAAFTFAAEKPAAIAGYGCDNMCPLATTANAHRAYGNEAVQASKVARADVAAFVSANLARV